MDIGTTGHRAMMQTWADESQPPVEIVWFRVPADSEVVRFPSPMRLRNYIGSREENAVEFRVGERDWQHSPCNRHDRLPWYRGNAPAPYRGLTFCGEPLVWQFGGNSPEATNSGQNPTPIIHTRADGTAACCDPLFLVSLAGEAEGSKPVAQVVIPAKVVACIAAQLTSCRLANVSLAGQELEPATNAIIDFEAPGASVGPVIVSWDQAGMADPNGITPAYSGEYELRAGVAFALLAPGMPAVPIEGPVLLSVRLYPGLELLAWASQLFVPTGLEQGAITVSCRARLPAGQKVVAYLENFTSAKLILEAGSPTFLEAVMDVPGNTTAGPTGYTVSKVEIGSGSEPIDQPREALPTKCPFGLSADGEIPFAFTVDDTATAPTPGEMPFAFSMDAEETYGVGGEIPFAFSADSVDTPGTGDGWPLAFSVDES